MLVKVITGVTGDVPQPACFLNKVRVGGTANLIAAIQVKQGATVIDTIPIGAVPGTEREYVNLKFDSNTGVLNINMGNAGDTAVVLLN